MFSLQPERVFYDLTSTYFEGNGPEGLARHGFSRDGKPRNRRVLVERGFRELKDVLAELPPASAALDRSWRPSASPTATHPPRRQSPARPEQPT
jgi:hypothetical protein